MNFDIIIIDASSIMNFFKYYHHYYSKQEHKIIFTGLKDFLVKKIISGEIIVLDKVYDELKSREFEDFRKEIEEYVIDSLIVFTEVERLMDVYYLTENEKFLNNNQILINIELEKYETTYADLYLISYAKHLKNNGKKVILITEESFIKDKKLIEKLPIICKKENEDIWCRNMPFALFDFYKNELEFSLDIKEK